MAGRHDDDEGRVGVLLLFSLSLLFPFCCQQGKGRCGRGGYRARVAFVVRWAAHSWIDRMSNGQGKTKGRAEGVKQHNIVVYS